MITTKFEYIWVVVRLCSAHFGANLCYPCLVKGSVVSENLSYFRLSCGLGILVGTTESLHENIHCVNIFIMKKS